MQINKQARANLEKHGFIGLKMASVHRLRSKRRLWGGPMTLGTVFSSVCPHVVTGNLPLGTRRSLNTPTNTGGHGEHLDHHQGWRDDQELGTGLMAKAPLLQQTILSRLGGWLRYLTHRNNTRDARDIKKPMTVCSKQKDNLQAPILIRWREGTSLVKS